MHHTLRRAIQAISTASQALDAFGSMAKRKMKSGRLPFGGTSAIRAVGSRLQNRKHCLGSMSRAFRNNIIGLWQARNPVSKK